MKIFYSLVLTIALFFVAFGCSEKETAGNATEPNTIGEVESSSSVVLQSSSDLSSDSSEIREIIFTTKPSSENLLGRTVVRVYQEEQGAQGSCTVGEIVFTAAFKIVGRGVLTYSSAQSVASYDMYFLNSKDALFLLATSWLTQILENRHLNILNLQCFPIRELPALPADLNRWKVPPVRNYFMKKRNPTVLLQGHILWKKSTQRKIPWLRSKFLSRISLK